MNQIPFERVRITSFQEDVVLLKWRAVVLKVCVSESEERKKVIDCVKRRRELEVLDVE